ncbi:MAG: molybdopterin-dependent oxidoreductase [Oscillibacter sp.]|nr:molybdopterin-dependent oxidoreductase [Oscillibacter sp.]
MAICSFVLNGVPVTAETCGGRTLLHYLRGVACLKGTKEGCSTGHCGACTVLVDGEAARACVTRLDRLEGKSVLTIEGIQGPHGELHPIQQAFLDMGAVQCGFCTPGMVMAAKALLDKNPDPSQEEICAALQNNYCRCTGYVKIIQAVRLAAARLRGENPLLEEVQTLERIALLKDSRPETVSLTGRHVGRGAPDADGAAKVTGTLPFTCDQADGDTWYGAFTWSRHPRARIRSIDCARAGAAEGVLRVLTHRDVPGENRFGCFNPEQPVLCETEVNFLGDMVALVVADTEEHARRAAALVEVAYEPLPGVFEIGDSYALGGERIIRTIAFSSGDLEAEQAAPGLDTVEADYYFERQEHACLEPECALGRYDPETGGVWLTSCTQSPFEIQRMLLPILGLPAEKVRVTAAPLGGGFGSKCDSTIEAGAALAAWVTGKTVQITLKRRESLLLSTKRHRYENHYRLAFDKEGRFRWLDCRIASDAGPYKGLSPGVLEQGCIFAAGPYRIGAARVRAHTVRTNTVQGGAFRGFGINQSANCMETLIDRAAEALGMDPFEIRIRNALRPGDRTMTGEVVRESVGILRTLEACRERSAPIIARYRRLYAEAEPHLALGVGVASGFKNVGVGKGSPDDGGCVLTKQADGTYHMALSGIDMGQGFRTAMVQIAAETLDEDEANFTLLNGDTAGTLPHRQAVSERQTLDTGRAVYEAAKKMREELEANPWKPGEVRRTVHEHISPRTYGIDGQEEAARNGDPYQNYRGYAFLTQCVILEVNRNTGGVRVLHVISANDTGRAINPQVIAGQIEGSFSMGMGYALSEGFRVTNGRPEPKHFGQLGLPRAGDTPSFDLLLIEDPHTEGPYGAKGISEVATVPAAPAIINALYDAIGVRFTRTPITPDVVRAALGKL